MNFFDRIQKPTLLLDEARVRANIQWMAAKAARSGARFRPHFKTHQSAEIGEWFREAGVSAITVSSVDMAAYFIRAGWRDVTIAFPVNLRQLGAIDELAGQAALDLLVESAEVAARLDAGLSHTVGVWIKVDAGSHRTGLPAEDAAGVLALARAIAGGRRLRLRGVLTHAGHTYHATPDEIRAITAGALGQLAALRAALRAAGFAEAQVSYGDTPGAKLADLSAADEIRPGNFVFHDVMQLALGACREDEIAVALACPVVAVHPERATIIVHGGAVHLSKETTPYGGQAAIYALPALPAQRGWGPVEPGSYFASLSQEHGVLHAAPALLERLRPGDLLLALPAHSCLAVDLMQRYLTLDGRWIEAMGKKDIV